MKTRYMAILASLIGCGGTEAYKEILPRALNGGITPVVVKEMFTRLLIIWGMAKCFRFWI